MSAPHPPTGSGREPATVRIAMWSARHRWPVVALWFVATIGLFGTSIALGGIKAEDASGGPNQRSIEASDAYDVFNAGGKEAPFEQVLVVVSGRPNAVADPAFAAAVTDLVAKLGAASAPVNGVDTKTFDQLANPLQAPPNLGLVSPDKTTVRIIGRINGDDARVAPLLAPIEPIVTAAKAANPGLTIHVID
ncbi:MAG: hypothetical protein QOI92_850, partial [Chloroflexota bacterium]|nr:hypothetical protein [Chloroflexota bacterium]